MKSASRDIASIVRRLIKTWKHLMNKNDIDLLYRYNDWANAADLHATVRYTTTKGMPHENVLWRLMAHVVNHGT
jgi:hypothetical protein